MTRHARSRGQGTAQPRGGGGGGGAVLIRGANDGGGGVRGQGGA